MIRLSGPGGSASDYEAVTTANLKSFLKIATENTDDDTLLGMLVGGVNRAAHQMTGRMLKQGTVDYDDVLDSSGGTDLYLPEYPVTAITSLSYVQPAGAGTFTVLRAYDSASYQLAPTSGRVALVGYPYETWPQGRMNIRAVYRAGYAAGAMPADLVMALCSWAAVVYQRVKAKRLDVVSLTGPSDSVSFTADEMPKGARDILAAYRRPEVGIV